MIESIGAIIKQIEGIGNSLTDVASNLGDISKVLETAKETAKELEPLISSEEETEDPEKEAEKAEKEGKEEAEKKGFSKKQISRMKKKVNDSAKAAKDKAKGKAKEILEKFKNKFASIPSEITGMFSSIMPSATEYMGGAKDEIEKFAEAATNLTTDLKAVTTAATAFAQRMAMIPTAIIGTCPVGPTIQAAAIPKELAQLKSDGDNLNTACTKALVSVGTLSSQIESAKSSFVSITNSLDKIDSAMTSISSAAETLDKILSILSPPGLGLAAAIGSAQETFSAIKGTITGLVKTASKAFETANGVLDPMKTAIETLQKIPTIVGSVAQKIPEIKFEKKLENVKVKNKAGEEVEVEQKSISITIGPLSKSCVLQKDPDTGKWTIPGGLEETLEKLAGEMKQTTTDVISKVEATECSEEEAEGKKKEMIKESVLKSPRRICKSCSGYSFNIPYFERYYGIVGDKKRVFHDYVLKGTSPEYSIIPGSDYQIYLSVKQDYDGCVENHLCCGLINWMDNTRKDGKSSQDNAPDDLDLDYPNEMGSKFPTSWVSGDELPATLCSNFK